jgi:hypothetical protein
MMGSLSDAPHSDAMGRGLALAFGAILGTALSVVLAILLIIAAVKGSLSLWGVIGALILLPLATVAMWMAGDAYGNRDYSAIWVPALLPPLFVLYALRARFPMLGRKVGEGVANIVLGGAILLLVAGPLAKASRPTPRDPAAEARILVQEKERVEREQAAAREARQREEAEFSALGSDSPLYSYLTHLQSMARHDRALEGIRRVKTRQADAIALLQQGRIVALQELWLFNLDPTPPLCQAYGAALAGAAGKVTKARSDYLAVAIDLEWQLDNIQWLLKGHCDLKEPLGLLESNVRAVADSDRMIKFADTLALLRQAN